MDEMMSWNPRAQDSTQRGLEAATAGHLLPNAPKCCWQTGFSLTSPPGVQVLGQTEVTIWRMSQGALALGYSVITSCQESGYVCGREPCVKGSLRASKPKKRQLSLWWN